RELWKYLAPLGNAGNASRDDPVCRKMSDVGTVEHDAARSWRGQTKDRAHQRRFARTVGAEQTGYTASLDLQRDALQNVGLVIGRIDTVDLEAGGHPAGPRYGSFTWRAAATPRGGASPVLPPYMAR